MKFYSSSKCYLRNILPVDLFEPFYDRHLVDLAQEAGVGELGEPAVDVVPLSPRQEESVSLGGDSASHHSPQVLLSLLGTNQNFFFEFEV